MEQQGQLCAVVEMKEELHMLQQAVHDLKCAEQKGQGQGQGQKQRENPKQQNQRRDQEQEEWRSIHSIQYINYINKV